MIYFRGYNLNNMVKETLWSVQIKESIIAALMSREKYIIISGYKQLILKKFNNIFMWSLLSF